MPLLLLAILAGAGYLVYKGKGASSADVATLQRQEPSLPAPLTVAIATALKSESDPVKLAEFSNALLPDFPGSSTALSLKLKSTSSVGRLATDVLSPWLQHQLDFMELLAQNPIVQNKKKTEKESFFEQFAAAVGDFINSAVGKVLVSVLNPFVMGALNSIPTGGITSGITGILGNIQSPEILQGLSASLKSPIQNIGDVLPSLRFSLPSDLSFASSLPHIDNKFSTPEVGTRLPRAIDAATKRLAELGVTPNQLYDDYDVGSAAIAKAMDPLPHATPLPTFDGATVQYDADFQKKMMSALPTPNAALPAFRENLANQFDIRSLALKAGSTDEIMQIAVDGVTRTSHYNPGNFDVHGTMYPTDAEKAAQDAALLAATSEGQLTTDVANAILANAHKAGYTAESIQTLFFLPNGNLGTEGQKLWVQYTYGVPGALPFDGFLPYLQLITTPTMIRKVLSDHGVTEQKPLPVTSALLNPTVLEVFGIRPKVSAQTSSVFTPTPISPDDLAKGVGAAKGVDDATKLLTRAKYVKLYTGQDVSPISLKATTSSVGGHIMGPLGNYLVVGSTPIDIIGDGQPDVVIGGVAVDLPVQESLLADPRWPVWQEWQQFVGPVDQLDIV